MKLLPYIGPALFLVACCLPAIEFHKSSGEQDIMFGLRALVVGWSGLFAGVTAWYANPLWLAGALFVFWRKPIPAVMTGVIAVAIGAGTFGLIGRVLPGDEGNVTKLTVVRLLPGCYVWFASLIAVPVAALIRR